MVRINSVIVPLDASTSFVKSRVVYLSPSTSGRIAYLVSMDDQALPEPVPEEEILKALKCGAITLTAEAMTAQVRSAAELPERFAQIRDAAWERIQPLVDGDSLRHMMARETRGSLIAKQAKKAKCQPTQLYRDVYRFFRGGMTKNALLPNFRSVEIGSVQPDGQQKRGRKPTAVLDGKRKNNPAVPQAKREQIKRLIKARAKQGMTKDDLLELTKDVLYNAGVVQTGTTTKFIRLPEEEQITPAQFKRIFAEIDEGNAITKRLIGIKRWNSKCKWRNGCSHKDVGGPGQRYEIDWTGTQIELVAADNPNRKVGTPIIYFVVDTWSNLVVGFFITLTGGDWDSASLALFNAISDKVDFCKHYGVDISAADWVSGVPFSVRGDRGPEVLSFNSSASVGSVGYDFQNARSETPGDKADVESRNGLFKKRLFRRLAGFRPKLDPNTTRNPRKDACLTLYDLIKIVIIEILEYNKRPMPLSAVPSIARKAGVRRTPIALWHWGMKELTGYLRTEEPAVLYTHLLPEVDGLISSDGLKVKRFLYTNDELERRDIFSSARRKGRGTEVRVRVDPQRPWLVFLPKSRGAGYLECERIDHEGHYREYLYDDVAEERKAHAAAKRSIDAEDAQRRSDSRAEQDGIQRRAKARAVAARTDGTIGGAARIRGQRGEERATTSAAQRNLARDLAGAKRSRQPRRSESRRGSALDAQNQDETTMILAAMRRK